MEETILSGKKVLVVEDNLINQKAAQYMLMSLGCEVVIANNGQQAIQLDPGQFDIIFMDMSLPDMTGLEVTQHYRHYEKADRHAIIIALTAHATSEDREQCLAAGMDAFMTKPLTKEAVISLLEKFTLTTN